MKITDLATRGANSRTAGKWRRNAYGDNVDIYHYGTLMLSYVEVDDNSIEVVDYSTGYGSVSDQGGMNKLFHALNLPYYYSRKGGASID